MSTDKSNFAENPASYNLSRDDLEASYLPIFQKFVQGYASVEFPRFIILGAQPGAGKSVLSDELKRQFANAAQPVHVDIDALREFHPLKDKILAEDPLNFGTHTHADSGIWTGYLLRDAKFSKNSILYEVSLRSPDWTKSEIESFKAEGYAIDMHILAVHENVSRLGIFQRFEGAIHKGEIPRYVPIEFHDQVYEALLKSVDILEKSCNLNRVYVHNRQGRKLYTRIDREGEPAAAKSILLERSRAWTAEEKEAHFLQWREVMTRAEARPEGILKPDWYMAVLKNSMHRAGIPEITIPAPAQEQDTNPLQTKTIRPTSP